MRGSVHSAIGASAPAALVVTGSIDPLQGVVMSAVSAGFALLPDVDHPNACATKALGPVVHRLVHALCKVAVKSTATGRDRSGIAWKEARKRDPYHRSLTHTLAVSAAMGTVGFLSVLAGAVPTGFVAAFGVFLLWPLWDKSVGLVVLGAAGAAVGSVLLLNPWLMALAVGGGYLSHVVADGCTTAGVPALWPLTVKGRRWWSLRLLGYRIRSGSAEERNPALGVALALNGLLLLLES